MTFNVGGLISELLDFMGVQLTTSTGYYIAFLACACILAVVFVSFICLLFRFLVYLRR